MRWRRRYVQGLSTAAEKQEQILKPRSLSSIPIPFLACIVIAIPAYTRAQNVPKAAAQHQPKWNDAVATLAGKIANLAGRGKTISLEVENISSLSQSDVTPIQRALDTDLAQEGFRLAPESSEQTRVLVTLSEGVEGYIWVAQVRGESDEQTAMVQVPKTDVVQENPLDGEVLLLEKKLVWRQLVKFLDFAVATTPDGSLSELVVLESDRFAYYRSSGAAQWAFWQAIPILRSSAWLLELRDLRGFIDMESGATSLPNITCTQSLDPSKVHCAPEDRKLVFPWRRVQVPGHEDSETMDLSDTCGEDEVVLSTGNGDWTQPDQIQGYLVGTRDEGIHPSGAPIPVDGPVISFARDAKGSGARAVVHNLHTGEYEGYVITANCSP